jgi:hypothetical protein
MSINHIFYKNNLIAVIETLTSEVRQQLIHNLVSAGSDPVAYKGYFQSLQQLLILHAQLIDKVYIFETDDPADYFELVAMSQNVHIISSRHAQ